MHAVVLILLVVGAVVFGGRFFLRQETLQSGDEARTVGVRNFAASAFSVNVSPHLTHVRAKQDFPEEEGTPTKCLNRNSKKYNFLYK